MAYSDWDIQLYTDITIDILDNHPNDMFIFRQNESKSRILRVKLLKGGEKFLINNYTVKYDATVGGYLAEEDASGNASMYYAVIPITDNMTAQPGKLCIDIKIVNGDSVLVIKMVEGYVAASCIGLSSLIDVSGTSLIQLINSKVPILRRIANLPLSADITVQQLITALGVSTVYKGTATYPSETNHIDGDGYLNVITHDFFVFYSSNEAGQKWVKINGGGSSINIDTGLNHTDSDDYVLSEKAVLENFSCITFSNNIPVGGTTTTGVRGELRYSSLTKRLFYCVSADDDTSTYIWKEILNTDTIETILTEYLKKSDVPEFVTGKNIFNSTMEFGNLRNSDGGEINSDTLTRSGFVKINPNQNFYLSYTLQDISSLGTVKYFFYNSNKEFISYTSGRGVKTTPNNTAYIRIILGEVSEISNVTNIQIEYGSSSTAYEPYTLKLPIDKVQNLQEELERLSNISTRLNSVGYKEFNRDIQMQISDLTKIIKPNSNESGYYRQSGTFVEDSNYVTNYYTAVPGMSYNVSTFVYFSSSIAVSISFFDENDSIISSELSGVQFSDRYICDYKTTAPPNAVVMAVTYRTGQPTSYSVVRELNSSNIVDEIKLKEGLNTHKSIVVGSRQRRPLISFLDDDGHSACYSKIFPIMKNKEIPFNIAFEGSEAPYDIMVDEQYQSYNFMRYEQLQEMIDYRKPESLYSNPYEGAEVVAHMGTDLTQKTGQSLIDYVESTYFNLTKRGIYPKGLAYAYGNSNEEVRDVVSRYYQYGVRTASDRETYTRGFNPSDPSFDPYSELPTGVVTNSCNSGVIANYYIHRIAMYGYYSSKAGIYDESLVGQKTFQGKDFPYYFTNETVLAWLKSCVDDAISNNGWLIFMTHSIDVNISKFDDIFTDLSNNPVDHEYIINELIDYIKTKNVEVVKMDYAFEIFGNALECGDYLGIDNNVITTTHTKPGLAINKLGDVKGLPSNADLEQKLSLSNVKVNYFTESGAVYDVTYINSVVGNIETLLADINHGGGVE